MHADIMRWIDRRIGALLCGMATAWDRLFGRRGPAGVPPHRILFIELAEMGALVVGAPAILRARARFPGAALYFLTFSRGHQVLHLAGLIPADRILVIRPDSLATLLVDAWRAVRRARREGIDATVNLECFARFSTLLAYFTGARTRVGYFPFHQEGGSVGDLVTHRVVYHPHVHAAESYMALVDALSATPDGDPMPRATVADRDLSLPQIPRDDAARLVVIAELSRQFPSFGGGGPVVLLNPNAGDLISARRWPERHFASLARRLMEDPGLLVVVTGLPGERARAEQLVRDIGSDRVLNMAGKTDLPQLFELYRLADLLITNDSGPAHFAGLVDLPVIALFGPETPRLFGPLGRGAEVVYLGLGCSPCVSVHNQKKTNCRDNRCMKDITPDSVLECARRVLAVRRPGGNGYQAHGPVRWPSPPSRCRQ